MPIIIIITLSLVRLAMIVEVECRWQLDQMMAKFEIFKNDYAKVNEARPLGSLAPRLPR